MTKTEIKAALKKLGYTIRDDSDNTFSLMDIKYKTCENTLYFSKEQLPFYCGVKEVGDLSFDEPGVKGKERTAAVLLAKYAFTKLRDENIIGRGKVKKSYPLLFCGNGVNDSLIVEEALLSMKDIWMHVSTTINPQSKNTIRVFISK